MKNRTAFPELPTKILSLTGQASPGGYRRLYGLAIDGAFPVERDGRRLYVMDADLPLVIAALGLSIASHTAA